MNRALMRYQWLGLRGPAVAVMSAAACLTVLVPAPLSPTNAGLHNAFLPLAILAGALLGLLVVSDPAGVDAWVLSRGQDRRRIFQARWVMGLLVLWLTAALMSVSILVGLRGVVQTGMGNGAWYPMVKIGELFVVRDFLLISCATYCSVVFFRSVIGIGSTIRGNGPLSVIIPGLAGCVVGACWRLPLHSNVVPFTAYVLAWVVICLLLTLSARAAYAEREVVA